jgi:hypothetical protein
MPGDRLYLDFEPAGTSARGRAQTEPPSPKLRRRSDYEAGKIALGILGPGIGLVSADPVGARTGLGIVRGKCGWRNRYARPLLRSIVPRALNRAPNLTSLGDPRAQQRPYGWPGRQGRPRRPATLKRHPRSEIFRGRLPQLPESRSPLRGSESNLQLSARPSGLLADPHASFWRLSVAFE